MQVAKLDRIKWFLALSLLACGLMMVSANLFLGKEAVKIFTDMLYIPIPGVAVVLSIILAIRSGRSGYHGKAWILYSISITSWFIADQIWTVLELVYHVNPFPSIADIFCLAGIPFFMVFSIFYFTPFRSAISKKMVLGAIFLSAGLLTPAVYFSLQADASEVGLGKALAISYPIEDIIMLGPITIGILLFLKGEVNFMLSLIFFGILCFVVADTLFLYATQNGTYYTGHPADLLYFWSFILFSFATYSNLKIFHKTTPQTRYDKQEMLK